MTLLEAIEYINDGGKVTSLCLPNGTVLAIEQDEARVIFQASGDSFRFDVNEEREAATYNKVEGWLNYVSLV